MRNIISKFALTAGLVLAITFTFSCSGDDGGGEEKFSYCVKDGFCHEGPYTLEGCNSFGGMPSNNCPNGGGGGSSSSGGGSPSSSSVGTQGGLLDLPKQVYLTEWDCCDDDGHSTVLKKEPFNGNGDIFAYLCLNSDCKGEYDSILVGKIQDGQLSLNLPASVEGKYLYERVPCGNRYYDYEDITCENNLSGVPENLAFASIYLHPTISDRNDCYSQGKAYYLDAYNPYLRNSGETGRARFYYFSESGRITGAETWTGPDWFDGSSSMIYTQRNYDINFSKGWNFVSINYHDPNDYDDYDNYMALTTDLSKGTWEWWLECDK
jgi:hypothetical protein